MKHVVKGNSPESFESWKTEGDESWEPSYPQLRNPQKHAVHQALLVEQAWVCCYCGRAITLSDSHIEHFRPQHPFEALQLSFDNLHASCLREAKPGLPLHCGHAKSNGFDESRIIDPQDPACEGRFIYTSLGVIASTDPEDERASYMATLLSLDIPFLRDARAEALGSTLDAEFLSTATEEELKLIRDAFRRPDENGKLSSFGHVIARFAEQYLPPSAG